MKYFSLKSKRRYCVTAIVMFVVFVHGSFAVTANTQNAASADGPELKPQEKIERELKGGEAHPYRITLKTGQYMRVVVEQKGIDVVITLFAPAGQKLSEVDSPNGTQGPEPVSWIAQATGEYQLKVKSLEDKAAPGRYEIKVEELREATPKDKDRIEAERAFAEAERFRAQGTGESLRKALKKYEEALSLWASVGNQRRQGETLHVIALCHARLSESQKAIEVYLEALPLRRLAGDRFGEAQTLINIGSSYYALSQIQKALEYFSEALNLARQLGSQDLEVQSLTSLGVIHSASDQRKALDYYSEALARLSGLKQPSREAYLLNGLGGLYLQKGEPQQALASHQKALALHTSTGDRRGEAGTLLQIARILRSLGETDRALEYLNRSLALQRAIGYRLGETEALTLIGATYLSSDKPQEAITYFQQAIDIARELGNRELEANALTGIAAGHHDSGEFQKALDYFNRTLVLQREIPSRAGEAWTLGQIGGAYDSMGNAEKAIEYLQQALEIQRAIGARRDEATTLRFLAISLQKQNRLDEARRQIELAINIVETSRTGLIGPQLRTSFSASTQKFYELYINVLMQLHQKEPLAGHDATAFGASERARARSLLELLTESRADIRQGVDPALLERERALQRQLNAKSERLTRLLSARHTEEQEKAARKEVEALLTDLQDIAAQIRIQSPRYAALTQPQPLPLNDIQQLLDEGTVLLEYALGEERSYAWVVTPSSVKSFELPKRAVIEAEARRVYGLLVNKSDDLDPAALADLSRMLLGPVADQLGRKRLLVVTDGALQYVPFGALPAPGVNRRPSAKGKNGAAGGYQPLILDHEVVSLPSASVVAVLRREAATRPPAPKKVAVLADPVFVKEDGRVKNRGEGRPAAGGGGADKETAAGSLPSDVRRSADDLGLTWFDRLPVSRREAELITASAPKGQSLKALDFAASRATATSEELSRYQIVHFATHSLLNNQHPELSGIVLSLVNERGEPQDGFLRLHDIYNLKLDADLVVLSACETALGKEINGEGLVGLTRGFMYAGAPRVVASLWKVGDSATAELMKRFYRNMLNAKMRPAAALRAAQVAMWKERQWAAPFYWAGFVIQGEWR